MKKNGTDWGEVIEVVVVALIYGGFIVAVLCSCSPRVVQVERTTSDSVRVAGQRVELMARRDSIYRHDSVVVKERGDTVTIVREHTYWRERWRTDSVVVHDTLLMSHRDSVPYAVEVEKRLTRWQRWRMELGGWAMGLLGVAVVYIVFRLWRRMKIF